MYSISSHKPVRFAGAADSQDCKPSRITWKNCRRCSQTGDWHTFIAVRVVCCLLLALPAPLAAQDQLLPIQHYDLAVNYDPESGWETFIYDFTSEVHLDAYTSVITATDKSRRELPDDEDFAILGNPGETIWIIPEIFDSDIVYLGIGAQLLGRNIFSGGLSNRGQITMRLLDVSGTGPDSGGTVSLWQSGFPPQFYFSSADGIDEEDALEAITANFHAHYNWGFSKPGLYRVTFEYSGKLVPQLGGEETSTQVTYTFQIENPGKASPLRYAWPLEDGWSWSSWMEYVFTESAPWIFLPDSGWWYVSDGPPDDFWAWSQEHGWLWTSQWYFPWFWDPVTDSWILK